MRVHVSLWPHPRFSEMVNVLAIGLNCSGRTTLLRKLEGREYKYKRRGDGEFILHG